MLQAFQLGEFPGSCCSWVDVNGAEWGPEPLSQGFGITPALLAPCASWLPPPLGQYSHLEKWAVGRQTYPDHINWNSLSQDSSVSISLWTLVCYTWCLAGGGISSLIAYIPNLLSLPVSSGKAITVENQFVTCAHPYSVLSTSGKYCPGNK